MTMLNIKVQRYADPKATGWAGYIEPRDLSWIAFVDLNGSPHLYLHRDPETGAVLPDDPVERASKLSLIRSQENG